MFAAGSRVADLPTTCPQICPQDVLKPGGLYGQDNTKWKLPGRKTLILLDCIILDGRYGRAETCEFSLTFKRSQVQSLPRPPGMTRVCGIEKILKERHLLK